MVVIGFRSLQHIPPGNWLRQKATDLEHPSIVLFLGLFSSLAGGIYQQLLHENQSNMRGTIVLDLQSSSCVHCQLFPPSDPSLPHTYSGPVAQPYSTGVHNQPQETTLTKASRGTRLHQIKWAN